MASLPDPVGEIARRRRPAQRSADPAGPRPARRRRHHLREPAQRDQRCRRRCASRAAMPRSFAARRRRSNRIRPSPRSCARACAKDGLPSDSVILVEDTSRESAVEFMRLRGLIDCLIPRGGPSAHRRRSWTTPPCPSSSTATATATSTSTPRPTSTWRSPSCVNAKTQRPSVCNAAERLLVHPRRRRRRCLPMASPPWTGSSWSATSACPPAGGRRQDRAGDRRGLLPGVPRPQDERGRGRRPRRRHRPHPPVRLGPHRGHRHL